jgi:hypothetical protein
MIVVTNCILTGCCKGLKFGTPTFGGFENITFSNSVIYNDDLSLRSHVIASIQLSAVDGGWVDGVVISGIQMRRVRSPICIRRGTRHTDNVIPQNCLRGIVINGLHGTEAILISSITGLPGLHVEDVRLLDIRIATVMPGKPEWVAHSVLEVPADYPQSRMFGWLPASGCMFGMCMVFTCVMSPSRRRSKNGAPPCCSMMFKICVAIACSPLPPLRVNPWCRCKMRF